MLCTDLYWSNGMLCTKGASKRVAGKVCGSVKRILTIWLIWLCKNVTCHKKVRHGHHKETRELHANSTYLITFYLAVISKLWYLPCRRTPSWNSDQTPRDDRGSPILAFRKAECWKWSTQRSAELFFLFFFINELITFFWAPMGGHGGAISCLCATRMGARDKFQQICRKTCMRFCAEFACAASFLRSFSIFQYHGGRRQGPTHKKWKNAQNDYGSPTAMRCHEIGYICVTPAYATREMLTPFPVSNSW